jgi:transcription elongation factor GreA
MAEERDLTLSEAVTMFLATLSPEQRQEGQQELNRFVRWYGAERPLAGITAREIGDYGQSISASVRDPEKKVEPVRAFLSYARKRNLVSASLAPHLRVTKAKKGRSVRRQTAHKEPVTLSTEGFASLGAELEALKKERPLIAEQIRLAAADKDVRENAPLEAARERQGHIEARIREIEATLGAATVVDRRPKSTRKVGIGSTVSLSDVKSGDQLTYMLVSPSEADPAQGRLSIASPTGKALLDNEAGATVEVEAPAGTLRYRIDEVKG